MKTTSAINKAIALSALAAALTGYAAQAHDMDMSGKEKCYGVAKAGKNDCASGSNGCAGMAKKDGDGFLAVPTGLCEKLVGGTLAAPAKK